ncbi:acyl carrier protein [Streptomyces sp. LX-29]|uniref:acyl carrier protein n=1 Tax=Streptomyces sp. LX-29 TaxID=2900152 RepID=UPI00240E11B4|nr:acyl carrier protein [Streptomyces sp. LX-29]WFB09325.1 acyl carrier protein [Streptomyces sp. LX-29]
MNDTAVIDMEDLRATVAEVLDIDEDLLTDEAHFTEDLDVDSLMALGVMVVLEKKYEVKLREEELKDITSLRRVHDLLAEKIRK